MANEEICEAAWNASTIIVRIVPTIYSCVTIFGFPGNLLALVILWPQIKQQNVLAVYLLNLCVSDLIFILTLPVGIHYVVHHDNWNMCKFFEFLYYTNMYSGVWFLCCISADRYVVVKFPLRVRGIRSMYLACTISSIIWAALIILYVTMIVSARPHSDEHHHLLCYDSFPLQEGRAVLHLCTTILGFVLPLLIMTFCNVGIATTILASNAFSTQEKGKITRLVLMILAIFIICFLPYHIILMFRIALRLKGMNCKMEESLYTPYQLAFAIASISSAMNPLLNIFFSETACETLGQITLSARKWLRQVFCRSSDNQPPTKPDVEAEAFSKGVKRTQDPTNLSQPD
uniref:G-protein coupled receptor 4-like n=1 Tax=Myxine glutinosa TaxID=7769 RepID=UPI00358F3BED